MLLLSVLPVSSVTVEAPPGHPIQVFMTLMTKPVNGFG